MRNANYTSFAHIASISDLETPNEDENKKHEKASEKKRKKDAYEYNLEVQLSRSRLDNPSFPELEIVTSLSHPRVLTVFQSKKKEDRLIVLLVHGPYNIKLQKQLCNNRSLRSCIDTLSSELAPKTRTSIRKKAKQFEIAITAMQEVFANRSKLFPDHEYVYVGQSFGATALYYCILMSNAVSRRMKEAHMFNPVTEPIMNLITKRKLHRSVRAKMNIHKMCNDALSAGVEQMFGNKLYYKPTNYRAFENNGLNRYRNMDTCRWLDYYKRLQGADVYSLLRLHEVKNFF
jgi:hypothetical protein